MAAGAGEARRGVPGMVGRVARTFAALALAVACAGCPPRVRTGDERAIEAALTPRTAYAHHARAIGPVTLHDEELGPFRLAGVEAVESAEVDRAARECLQALVESETVEIALSRARPHDSEGLPRAAVYILGGGRRICVNAELLRRGLARAERDPVREFDVRSWSRERPGALPARAERRLPEGERNAEVVATPSGKCYHRPSCPHAKGGSPLSLEAALRRGLEPCTRCRPPKESP